MKLYDVIAYSTLSENNEDMFPGVGSSVFSDVKAKDQPEIDPNNIDWLDTQIDKYVSMRAVYEAKSYDILKDMEKNGALNYYGGYGSSPGPNEILYSAFDWFDKFNVQGISKHHAIETSSPFLQDIENTVGLLDRYYKRQKYFQNKVKEFQDTKVKIAKGQRKDTRVQASKTFDSLAKTIPKVAAPSPIPTKIPVKNKRPIQNPYVNVHATNQYAGNVFHYPDWSAYWKNQIVQISDILKRNGKGGLELMYASTHSGGARFNFVITGANGNLTWRKYDPAPGAGQNWIFLNGKKLNTSSLLNMNNATQDKAVQPL